MTIWKDNIKVDLKYTV